MNSKLLLLSLLMLVNLVKCDMYLRLEMESFHNPNGIKNNMQACHTTNNKCLTYFKFCLKTSASLECVNEFKTQIIGENTISSEQFRLTTNSIEFPIAAASAYTYLMIEAFNEDGQLISEWKLDNLLSSEKFNSWNTYNQVNEKLNQQITFNYKVQCANGYQGSLCQRRKWIFLKNSNKKMIQIY